jgi:hypothetical protein
MYDQIFISKFLKYKNKCLIINNKYIDTSPYDDFINEKKINIIQSMDILDDILEQKFDLIIVIELFSLCYDDIINDRIDKIKNILEHEGKILFVEKLIIKEIFKPISDLKKILFPYCFNLFQKDILMSDLYDTLRDKEFRIMDVNRILSIDDFIYDTDYYTILCRLN